MTQTPAHTITQCREFRRPSAEISLESREATNGSDERSEKRQ